jgi:hypothetical protein
MVIKNLTMISISEQLQYTFVVSEFFKSVVVGGICPYFWQYPYGIELRFNRNFNRFSGFRTH